MALENHQLVTEDRQLDVAVQIVRGAGDQPHHTTQQEIQQSEQHVPTSHDMKEGRSYERTGRGADRWFLCPSSILQLRVHPELRSRRPLERLAGWEPGSRAGALDVIL
jgi:hypothetical protein